MRKNHHNTRGQDGILSNEELGRFIKNIPDEEDPLLWRFDWQIVTFGLTLFVVGYLALAYFSG